MILTCSSFGSLPKLWNSVAGDGGLGAFLDLDFWRWGKPLRGLGMGREEKAFMACSMFVIAVRKMDRNEIRIDRSIKYWDINAIKMGEHERVS